eukprot:gene7491-1339_t
MAEAERVLLKFVSEDTEDYFFQIKKTTLLEKAFDNWCNITGNSRHAVAFLTMPGLTIDGTQTAASYGLTDNSVVKVISNGAPGGGNTMAKAATPSRASSVAASGAAPKRLTVKVADAEGRTIDFQLRPDSELSRLMDTYCQMKGKHKTDVEFRYDGILLFPNHTPEHYKVAAGEKRHMYDGSTVVAVPAEPGSYCHDCENPHDGMFCPVTGRKHFQGRRTPCNWSVKPWRDTRRLSRGAKGGFKLPSTSLGLEGGDRSSQMREATLTPSVGHLSLGASQPLGDHQRYFDDQCARLEAQWAEMVRENQRRRQLDEEMTRQMQVEMQKQVSDMEQAFIQRRRNIEEQHSQLEQQHKQALMQQQMELQMLETERRHLESSKLRLEEEMMHRTMLTPATPTTLAFPSAYATQADSVALGYSSLPV